MQPRLLEFLADRNGVVVHSDLHERQLLTDGATLAAVLDFNDAVVGRLEWDFGSYLYFHGQDCLSDLLDGYTDDVSQKSRFADNALLAGILIALHHGNRGVLLGIPDRIQASAKFLKGWLGAS
jgi:aminoglycoside phosphotransferase (APT) family kinase protein